MISAICLSMLLVSETNPTITTTKPPSAGPISTLPTTVGTGISVPGSKVVRLVKPAEKASGTLFVVDSVIELERIVDGLRKSEGAAKKEREKELRRVLSAKLDLGRLGQRAMITHWETLGKTSKGRAQRDRYMKLFRDLLEENYIEQARKYIGGDYEMTLTGEQKEGDSMTIVNGRIKKPDVDVLVEFDVFKDRGVWRIADIKLDATSLEATYRSSFNRIIKKKGNLDLGFQELLSTMDKRLAELRKGKATRF